MPIDKTKSKLEVKMVEEGWCQCERDGVVGWCVQKEEKHNHLDVAYGNSG